MRIYIKSYTLLNNNLKYLINCLLENPAIENQKKKKLENSEEHIVMRNGRMP